MPARPSSPTTAPDALGGGGDVPVEVAALFYTGLNEPKPTSVDFSRDGSFFLSSHSDDAVRLVDVMALHHTETIACESVGVHMARFTQSSRVVCLAPRHPLDGQLHLLDLETAQFAGEMAYFNAREAELRPASNAPVYTSLTQCPATDVLAAVVSAKEEVALFHPLISGAIAASSEGSVTGSKPTIAFSPDGNVLVVGDDTRVTLFDRRLLFSLPLAGMETAELFAESPKNARRCKGVDCSPDGEHLLLTASSGEVAVYSWKLGQVVRNYYHDDARRHFLGSADAIGAKYVHPYATESVIAQPTTSMVGGRHLLVYEGYDAESERSGGTSEDGADRADAFARPGALLYELQSKDSDVPVALAVNPRYSLVATAARHVTWWSFNS